VPVIKLALSIEAPELDASSSWSAFESLAVQMSKDVPTEALAQALDELQERLIDQVCGPKWAPARHLPAPFACPGCGAGDDFARKGRRTRLRRFDTAAGRVEVRLWHVGCRSCGKVFAPLLELMNLHGKRRTDRLTLDLAELSSQVSFHRSATIAGGLSARRTSAGGAHRALADVAAILAPNGRLGAAVERADVVILDGTGVRAGKLRLGADCNLAIGLIGRSGPLRRRRAHAELLGLTVGERWAAMDDQLQSLAAPKVVVVDGEEAVTKVAQRLWPEVPQQRCWWHLARGFRWALYADHAPAAWANAARAHLVELLRDSIRHELTVDEGLERYDTLVDTVEGLGHQRTVSLLTVARPQVFTCLDGNLRRHLAYLGGPELGSGVIERAMRDINARVDIGGSRWSVPGIRDTITVLAARRFAHPSWEELLRTLRPDNTMPFHLAKFNAG
jgi:hypothetical protein